MKRLLTQFFSFFLLVLMIVVSAGCTLEIKDETNEDESKKTTAGETELEESTDTTAIIDTTEIPVTEPIPEKTAVERFFELLYEGNNIEALILYNEEIANNYYDQAEVELGLNDMLAEVNDKVLKGEYAQKDVDIHCGLIEKIVTDIEMPIDLEYWGNTIAASLSSKASYSAAVEFESLKYYAEAIAQYKLVIETDSNYSAATGAVVRCSALYKEEKLEEAEKLISSGEYKKAMETLNSMSAILPNDSDVESKKMVYKTMHIRVVLSEADSVFVTPKEDYLKALNIINGALQFYGDDSELADKKAYYESFAPINLYDMKSLKGSATKYPTDSDIYGNKYKKCFIVRTYTDTDISFYLNKEYNIFSSTLYCRSTSNVKAYMRVKIYADGKLIYEKDIADNSTKPFNIELDLTGVDTLRIVLADEDYTNGGIGMTNMFIQRTVK